jgi:hypothetical protein
MCSHLCQNILRFLGIKSKCNVCCICYCETPLGNFFVLGILCESYIQCKLGVDIWIFTNI